MAVFATGFPRFAIDISPDRLPVIAVLVFQPISCRYGIITSAKPAPPLALLVLNGFHDANLAARLPASFGAIWQIGLVMTALLLWWAGETLVSIVFKYCSWRGWRRQSADLLLGILSLLAIVPLLIGVMGLFAALIWSFAKAGFSSSTS